MVADPLLEAAAEERPAGGREPSRAWQKFWRHPLGRIGAAGIVFIVLFSFVGPFIYRASPYATNLMAMLAPPTGRHLLGTDSLGRDYLARVMLGGQLSLIVGFASAIATMMLGVAYGLVSGYLGGVADGIMMRIVDVFLTIPGLFILLLLDSIFRPSAVLMVFIIAFTSWFSVSRLVRSEVLSLKTRDYVEAARAFGVSGWHIMTRELLPNVMGTVMVATTFQVAGAILTVATLSFLGLGLPPPTPNWGGLLSESMNYMYQGAWWLVYPPGLCLLLTMLSFNFLSEALQSALDARL